MTQDIQQMTLYIVVEESQITIRGRLEGPGGIIGDIYQVLNPGERFGPLTYDLLKRHGSGELKLPGQSSAQHGF